MKQDIFRHYLDSRHWFNRKRSVAPVPVLERLKTKLESLLADSILRVEKEGVQDLIFEVEIELEKRKNQKQIYHEQQKDRNLNLRKLKPNKEILILLDNMEDPDIYRKVQRELIILFLEHYKYSRRQVAKALAISHKTIKNFVALYLKGELPKKHTKRKKGSSLIPLSVTK